MSRADRWFIPALLAWTGLFAWLFAWIVWLAPPEPALQAPALLIALGPLVWFHRGILAGRPRTHAAVSVLACLYLAHGAFELMVSSVPAWLAAVETLLAVLLLLTTAFHARTRGRANRGL